jgi:cysteine synthase B
VNIFALKLKKLWTKYGEEFNEFFYSLGYGHTPLEKLPSELNLYDNIYIKREDLEPTGSIKIRAAAGIHFLKEKEGKLNNKEHVTLASSGNFAKDLPKLFNELRSSLRVRDFISKKTIDHNPELIRKKDGDIIPVPEHVYCPMSKRERGRAITNSIVESETDPRFIVYNQYGDIGNPFGNLTLGEENYKDIGNEKTVLAQGLGTNGSAIGNFYGYYFSSGKYPKFVGLLPHEKHHQLGLRSKKEQGDFYYELEKFADIETILDKEAFEILPELWEHGIPAGITTGTNVAGSLKVAEEFKDYIIITLMPDSINGNNYRFFLENNFEEITGKPFDESLYNSLQ